MNLFNPCPKKKRLDLPPQEYRELRLRVYMRCHCLCEVCGFWMSFEEFSMHHILHKSAGGDDVESNILACHVACHPD